MAVDRQLPRYELWLALAERGTDPESLSCEAALAFCHAPLRRYLHACGADLAPRQARRLRRSLARFDPARPTPAERLEALTR